MKKLKSCLTLLASVLILLQTTAFARTNLSSEFINIYNKQEKLSTAEIKNLKNYDIYLIPGILVETLTSGDKRTPVKLTLLLKDYFQAQLKLLNDVYKIPAKRLGTSSYDINITKKNIRNAVALAAKNKRKVIFISHSLGGLVLVDELATNKNLQDHVAGVAFLQSPFQGTELADLLLDPPWGLEKAVKKLLPVLNISERTIQYVGAQRKIIMKQNKDAILAMAKKIPVYTLSSTVEANKSLFKPAIDLNESGCLKTFGNKCISDVIYHGTLDKTDGLIPFKSSFIDGVDYVVLKNMDHAEMILNTPYETYKKEHITTTVLRVLLKKINKIKI